jgi:hypothetical protein
MSQPQVGQKPPSLASLQVLPTITLLSLMAAIGVVTAIIGYTFGQNSLKGTTQPVVNPIFGVGGGTAQAGGTPQEPAFRRESDILKEVKAITGGLSRSSPEASPSPSGSPSGSPTTSPSGSPSPSPSAATGLPREAKANDVTLAIRSSQRQAGDLILNVSLQNKGKRSFQFLYTFLEITDDRGRPLTAETRGLPTDLKAESGEVTGTITIPAPSIDGAKSISIKLSDYPNQSVTLTIPNIAVN